MCEAHWVGKHLIILSDYLKAMPEKTTNSCIMKFSIQTKSITVGDHM